MACCSQPILFHSFFIDNVETNLPETDFLYASNASTTDQQRRSSVPTDNLSPNRNNCHNGKTKNRKKTLKRRLSGGAEILCPIVSETEPSCSTGGSPWYRFKRSDAPKNRSDMDLLLSRRRGSLPVEVLTVCHTGKQ